MPDLSGLSIPGLGEMSAVGMAVVVILLFLSVWSLGVSLERLIAFARARRQSLAFARVLAGQHRPDWVDEAMQAAGKFPHSHLARVVSAGLLTFQKKRAKPTLSNAEVLHAVERSLERSTVRTSADLRRGVGGLATIATTAPFIGLFGTVIGIMHAFEDIAGASGAGGFATVSQGIAEALAATALGLLVAIPAAWMYNYLSGRIDRLNAEMETSSSELMDFFLDMGTEDAAA
ncbi:MAG TPA: MotA/TolQ/ExbB proton channel family protein [Thermoanaerobaculia bacterium]|nr:MotA/TolQ/ExbB proton channel family protein [Thermoanaerobaculia bacterium]